MVFASLRRAAGSWRPGDFKAVKAYKPDLTKKHLNLKLTSSPQGPVPRPTIAATDHQNAPRALKVVIGALIFAYLGGSLIHRTWFVQTRVNLDYYIRNRDPKVRFESMARAGLFQWIDPETLTTTKEIVAYMTDQEVDEIE